MIHASVHRVSASVRQDAMKFCVNGDSSRPMTLTDAILQAKVDCFDDLWANRPAEVAICSTETGEVLMAVRLNKDLVFRIEQPVYVCHKDGNLLHPAFGIEEAISWADAHRFEVVHINGDHVIVTDPIAGFMR